MGGYPSPQDLATIAAPVVCTYGSRSRSYMRAVTCSLARAIPTASVREIGGAAHAVAFDAPGKFAQVIAEVIHASEAPGIGGSARAGGDDDVCDPRAPAPSG